MENTKTQVFKIKDDKMNEIINKTDFNEKVVQEFYEKHLEQLLDAEFVESEYAFEGGRIDTFAYDSDFRPTIIEYKRNTNDSVLLQALFYKNFIQNNWEKVYKTILDAKGKKIADQIDWSNIRVVLIAQNFDKWTIASTTFLRGIELYRFSFYGKETFIQEFLSHKNSNINKIKKKFTSDNVGVPMANNADYSKDEYVISNISGVKYKTNVWRYKTTSNEIKKLYEKIEEYIFENFDQVEMVYKKDYWFVKAKKKFIEFMFGKNEIRIMLPKEIKHLNIKDKSNVGSWGSLKGLYKISSIQKYDELIWIINQAYKLKNS